MEETPPALVVIGSPEFRASVDRMDSRLSAWPRQTFADVGSLIDQAEGAGVFADLIVVRQDGRDQFPPDEIQKALNLFPLARWICVTGAWCESEGRHGSLWPDAIRVPKRSFRARLLAELAVIQGTRPPLPLTADREEIFEFDSETESTFDAPDSKAVSILASDPEFRDWLVDLLQLAGLLVEADENSPDVQCLIFDYDAVTSDRYRDWQQRHPEGKTLALTAFPAEENQRTIAADRLLEKLSPPAELLTAVAELLRPRDRDS